MNVPEVKIESIFYCLFDPKEGPQIKYQVPEAGRYVDNDAFHSIQNYLIPKVELQQKLITVKAFGHKILGCPVHIEKPIYSRNAFMFNVCFVFKPNANVSCYERVLKKLVQYFMVLELESNYLSSVSPNVQKGSFIKKEFYTPLNRVLEEVLEKLNSVGCCVVPIDAANTIHLKLVPSYDVPAHISDHDVPLLTFELEEYHFHQWDLATQQVLPIIDGFKHVSLIAAEAGKDVQLVKTLIENLLYFKLVKVIPIFQYSNVYVITANIQEIYTSAELQRRCLKAVKIPNRAPPSFDDVLKVYSCFTHGKMTTVKHVCVHLHPETRLGIDIRKLIQFGVLNNFIRRIHKYPVKAFGPQIPVVGDANSPLSAQILEYCDGSRSYDEICCALGLNYEELDALIEENGSIVVCWK